VGKYTNVEVPPWARQVVASGRFFQNWGMYAPEPKRLDGHLVIDARLTDGRRLDPQTGEPPVFELADGRTRSFDLLWSRYTNRLAETKDPIYARALVKWLLAPTGHLELGQDERIGTFDVWWIPDRSPYPGSDGVAQPLPRRVVVRHPRHQRERSVPHGEKR